MTDRHAIFSAGPLGAWRITSITPYRGDTLPAAQRLDRAEADALPANPAPAWALRGVRSNLRYTNTPEHAALNAKSEGLGRPASTRAALLPITKSAAWWALAQDERRNIFEETSAHIAIGMRYLPNIARRLYHSRDLGEPVDFLTWFEFAPADEPAFNDLLAALRATHEWTYVTREVDVRLDLA